MVSKLGLPAGNVVQNIRTILELTFIFLEIKKVLLILTDGRSNTGQVSRPAKQLKNPGVEIFSVGIGQNLSIQKLRVMASEPVDQHVIAVENLAELEHLAEKISSRICEGKCINGWCDNDREGVMIIIS